MLVDSDLTLPSRPVVVIGLGYIGLPLAASLAAAGRRVVGVETDPVARAAIAAGRPLFHEPGLVELLASLPVGTLDIVDRMPAATPDAVVVCVGTAVDPDTHRPDLAHLETAVDQLAAVIDENTLVIVRSTVPAGTCRRTVLPRLRRRVQSPRLAFCPERTIQGTALAEMRSLPQIIGGLDDQSDKAARELLGPVMPDQVSVSSLEAAELVKLICNAHTDLIYGFGNEVAFLAEKAGVDAVEVIGAANLRYPRPDIHRPGFVGGSCLVKDPYLLTAGPGITELNAPMVRAARQVNEAVPHHAVDRVLAELESSGRPVAASTVLVCGIAYKGRPATDDVRGSAASIVRDRLAGRVARLLGHDPLVPAERVTRLGFEAVPLADGLRAADAVFLLTDHPDYVSLASAPPGTGLRADTVVYDVWGLLDHVPAGRPGRYLRLGRG